MTGPSYATAAATISPVGRHAGPQHQVQDLYTPPPTSMSLVAALYLLDNPLFTQTSLVQVSLITKDYLQNWLVWAYHQPVIPEETRRLQLALRMAADTYQLQVPKLNDEYNDASPVDSSPLSDEAQPLVLRDKVVLWEGKELKEGEVPCCAVPARFYEILRSVHGVLCENGKSVSFQGEGASILHDPTKPPNGHLRPIDFSRQVVLENEPEEENGADAVAETAVTKLMKPDKPSMTPKVEIYPQKFNFKVVVSPQEEESASSRGASFLMASKTCQILDVLNAVMKTVAPQKASPCVRLWCKHQALRQDGKTNATLAGDGYELIDLENFQGKMDRPDITKEKSEMTVKEWVARRGGVSDLIVETRINNKTDWARESFELEYRVQVGDFVDAQDSTGKWYEAIVRDVSEDIVTVHYAGWATRWNGKIQRHPNGPKDVDHAAKCVVPIAPLWTHTTRWREGIEMGHQLEIRDSTSNVLQPKWFRGTVVKVGRKGGTPKDLYDGAMLEKLEAPTTATTKVHKNNMLPLLILLRMQQVLVEIPQEKHNNPALVLQTANDDDEENPPFIRWVNLYGEEICTPGTHMKILSDEKRPATINYDFDPRKPPVEILKTHLGSGFVRESLRGQPPAPGAVGLQNLGNSCFMNSIVQCLNHCDPVSEYFVSEEYAKDLNRRNPLGSGGRVAMAYASLLSDIWRGQYSALAPRLLKQTIANFAPQFNNVYQHDSHEFCSFLMDGIHEDCNRVDTKPYVEELEGFGVPDDKVAIESWRRHLLRHDSIIVDNCQGMHRSHVTCPICSRESIKFDVFSSLSVPLTSSKDRSFIPLDDCLEKFTEGEQLDENNAWYCPNCKKHVCALKMLALWSVPDILIIHLKRFTYEQKRNGSVVRSKIEDRVVFPVDGLDMSPYLLGPVDEAAPPIFNLFGVSEHSGTTANSGHYTATVRNSKDGKWYRYNDSHVGTSSGEASVTGGAYLLFYKRAKGTAKWAGMAKVMEEASIDPHGALDTDVDGFKSVKTKKNKKKAP